MKRLQLKVNARSFSMSCNVTVKNFITIGWIQVEIEEATEDALHSRFELANHTQFL